MTLNGNQSDGTYAIPDLCEATYLLIHDVRYLGLRWSFNNGKRQAKFVFEMPPDNILAEWLKSQKDYLKRYDKAREDLRDRLEDER